ncbi:MAG: undecaprenyl-phosphate glucose phosphotransferase, partial [Lachnospiraceae bacterium]|nr:undecaprenyl-phosphate glucose phosphotransferase [Lachnospiraceae bacterium]
MIKDNQRIFNRLHVAIDAVVVALSYLFAWYLKFKSGLLDYEMGLSMETYFMALYFIIPGYLLLYQQFDLYSSKRASGRKRELFNIIKSNTVGLVAFIVVLYIINNPDFSRQMIFIFWAVNIVAETAVR